MKILSAADIRLWDQYTIAQEPIASIDLMERASSHCAKWLEINYPPPRSYHIFCGKGNNGGDGLAIARLLSVKNSVTVHVLESLSAGTSDFQANLNRLQQFPTIGVRFIQSKTDFPICNQEEIIVDALYGTGLNRQLETLAAELVNYLNDVSCEIVSIDLPSGLFADSPSVGNAIIHASHTISFQCIKKAFLLDENEPYTGRVHILDIGLHADFYKTVTSTAELIDPAIIHSIYKPRAAAAHKGTYGHALLVAGSYGKIGAAVLAANACLRSGVGLLTCHIPQCGYSVLQSNIPEAMVLTDFNSSFNTKIEDDLSKYKAIGIGPGLGKATETKTLIRELLHSYPHPLVIDADALNIIAGDQTLLNQLPTGSILTPHPKEFERLFGKTENGFERIDLALSKAAELQVVIVLKGHHTLVATPTGKAFFNSTGNAGMATAGSGDTLTGILTGLLAQGYSSADAAVLGVYLHGLAGDLAAKEYSMEAMIASDIIRQLGKAFLKC